MDKLIYLGECYILRYLVQFQINIFAFMILVTLYLIIRTRSKVKSYGKTLLKLMMLATGIAIIVEPLTWIFDGLLFPGAFFLEYSTNMALFMMGPIIGGLAISYVDYSVFKDPNRIRKKMYYMHLSLLTLFILFYNVFNPIYFDVDPITNGFKSGVLKEVHYAVLAGVYLYMLYFIVKNKNKLSRQAFWIFINFFALPILGMVALLFDSKLHFSWTVIVLGILVIYIFLESSTNEEDYLTKLYNRKSSELYITHMFETKEAFGVIILDLNLFKNINDNFGHLAGDIVLIEFAKTLQKVFYKDSLVARIGGDEFFVVMRNPNEDYLQKINHVKHLLKTHENPHMNTLTFGYGYQAYNHDLTIDEMYSSADQKMYQNKRLTKNELSY